VGLTSGCGSSPSNFYDAPSAGLAAGSTAAGAASTIGGAGGLPAAGGAGAGSVTNGGKGGGSGSMNQGNAPCSPVKDATGMMSGEFGTMGPVCIRVTDDIVGWGCSNFDGRTLKINGQPIMCGALPLPDKIDGAYYFEVSGGTYDYASFYWY
jgi:endoglucanase